MRGFSPETITLIKKESRLQTLFGLTTNKNIFYDNKMATFLIILIVLPKPDVRSIAMVTTAHKNGAEQPTPTSAYDSLLTDRSSRTIRYRTTYRPISQY